MIELTFGGIVVRNATEAPVSSPTGAPSTSAPTQRVTDAPTVSTAAPSNSKSISPTVRMTSLPSPAPTVKFQATAVPTRMDDSSGGLTPAPIAFVSENSNNSNSGDRFNKVAVLVPLGVVSIVAAVLAVWRQRRSNRHKNARDKARQNALPETSDNRSTVPSNSLDLEEQRHTTTTEPRNKEDAVESVTMSDDSISSHSSSALSCSLLDQSHDDCQDAATDPGLAMVAWICQVPLEKESSSSSSSSSTHSLGNNDGASHSDGSQD